MALSKSHEAVINKLRAAGGGKLGVRLDDEILSYLVAVISRDLRLDHLFPEVPRDLPEFFDPGPLNRRRLPGLPFSTMFERLVDHNNDADTYFICLATLHRARLKYERILRAQPTPNIDQVGPRGLLQYGSLSPRALAGLLFWRKWIYDIDNRAAQEMGYVFEPIVAHAIGGVPFSAKKSPVKRGGDGAGRQVDCLKDDTAYEIKLRVTIAASGQGRWREELEFPNDCRASGYKPVLIVFDPTPNPKLEELQQAFLSADGDYYVGDDAWQHLENAAGPTMAAFLEKYVRHPIQALLEEAPSLNELPEIRWAMTKDRLEIAIEDETLVIQREAVESDEELELPEDVDDHIITP